MHRNFLYPWGYGDGTVVTWKKTGMNFMSRIYILKKIYIGKCVLVISVLWRQRQMKAVVAWPERLCCYLC